MLGAHVFNLRCRSSGCYVLDLKTHRSFVQTESPLKAWLDLSFDLYVDLQSILGLEYRYSRARM